MDAFAKGLHFWATQHELQSISEDPFSATTLKGSFFFFLHNR